MEREPELLLRHGPYEAAVSPQAGGRVTRLTWRDNKDAPHELLVPLREQRFEAAQWPKAGAFAMLPFANRLPNAGVFAQDAWQRDVPGAPPGHQHGLGLRRPWQVLVRENDHAVLGLDHAQPNADWPWCFQAQIALRLGPHGLDVTVSLTNTSQALMPASIGWHPYHPRGSTGLQSVHMRSEFEVPLHPAGSSGARKTWRAWLALEDAYQLREKEAVTTAFSGWNQSAEVRVDAQVQALISAQGWEHLVLHHPAEGTYVCVEPVSLLPGQIGQLSTLNAPGPGMLAPGQTLSGQWRCEAQLIAAAAL